MDHDAAFDKHASKNMLISGKMSNELTILKDIKDETGTKNDRGNIIFCASYSGSEGGDGIMASSTEGL